MVTDRSDPRRFRSRRRWLPLALAALVSAVTGVMTIHVDGIERERIAREAREAVTNRLAVLRSNLEFTLNEPLVRARGVVAHIIVHDGISESEFETMGEVLLKDQPVVRNMIVSRGLVIAMTYPRQGNESVIGVDFRSVPAQYRSVRQAIEARAPLLQGPIPLIQGGTGLILRNPVFLKNGTFFGMANVVLDVDAVFAAAGFDDPDLPFSVAVRGQDGRGKDGAMIRGDEALFASHPVTADVRLADGSWYLAAVPKGGWPQSSGLPLRVRLVEIFAFLAMTAIAFGAAIHSIGQEGSRQALRAKSEDLERSNADLERFAFIASHDLKTPLRNVASYAQLLARRYKGRLDGDADDFIGFIVDGSNRMGQLIDDLLTFARAVNVVAPAEPMDAGRALDRALENLRPVIGETGASVRCEPLPWVLAEPLQTVRLFQNLIDNAIKYAAPGRPTRVTVTALCERPGWWTFRVIDNGIGIAPEYFAQIFEVFQRLHGPGDRPGTGIGLAVCRRIVHQFGGDLWVESEVGKGSTFLFTLPQAAAPPAG